MRQHKYRAWDKHNNIMLDDDYMFNHFDYADFSSTRYDVMGWIGLKDRGGVEIYEGDILIDVGGKTIIMEYGECGNYYDDWVGFTFPEFFDMRTMKVAGNIYENPELLETKC